MNRNFCIALLAIVFSFTACSDEKEEELSAYERIENSFKELMGGEFSPMQWWRTAVQLKVSIKTPAPTSVSAYSLEDETSGILYDYQQVSQDSVFYLTVPQTANRNFVVMAVRDYQVVMKDIMLTGTPQQSVDLEVPLPSDALTKSPQPVDESQLRAGFSVYGTDILPNEGYTEVDPQGIATVIRYTEEGMDPIHQGLNGNYELISQGPFSITMYYGFTGDYSPHILGYYRHSPGTYQDLELIDLVDTHSYDYIDDKAKLQYQLDGQSRWYDSNFDYRDGYSAPFTTVTDRLNDDVYNIQHVIERYGNRITKARGLTWKIDVKPGDRIGFYLKKQGTLNNTQRERIIKKGLPANRLPSPMYEMNWSAQALNVDGKHRSIIIKDNGYTIMGMEDASSDGDFDCNDVLFGVHAELESEMPIIARPDVDGLLPATESMVWTLAYEDLWREADFDFNDAVIRLSPNVVTGKCGVTVMAAGSTAKMYLHYDGPDGDQNLGEIHELMGQKSTSRVNTQFSYAPVPFVSLDSVRWLNEYTMAQDAQRFYIEVQRGICEDCGELLMLPHEPGIMPQAILVVGSWRWPMEGTHICEAYPYFSYWAMDPTNTTYWNWHTSPQANTYVSY